MVRRGRSSPEISISPCVGSLTLTSVSSRSRRIARQQGRRCSTSATIQIYGVRVLPKRQRVNGREEEIERGDRFVLRRARPSLDQASGPRTGSSNPVRRRRRPAPRAWNQRSRQFDVARPKRGLDRLPGRLDFERDHFLTDAANGAGHTSCSVGHASIVTRQTILLSERSSKSRLTICEVRFGLFVQIPSTDAVSDPAFATRTCS